MRRRRSLKSRPADESAQARAHRLRLIASATLEIVPTRNLARVEQVLPRESTVSVVGLPAKGLEATLRAAEELKARGHDPIPHIAARMVESVKETGSIAAWCRDVGVRRMFVVAGDADPPQHYSDSLEFLGDLLGMDHGLDSIGVSAYPDHHPLIADEVLEAALEAKQSLLADAGVGGWCRTQMCFDASQIEKWMKRSREQGMTLPIHLGVPGAVDVLKLAALGMRLGIGASLKYLGKNTSALGRLVRARSYDPNSLLVPLSTANLEYDVDGLHLFTFNQIEATEAWRRTTLAGS